MLQAHGLTKNIGGRCLFAGLQWQLQRGDRVGLVGPNGAGKTTLLRLLAGDEPADGGHVSLGRDESMGFLPQEAPRLEGGTVLERTLGAAAQARAVEAELRAVEAAMGQATPAVATELAARHAELTERFFMLDGHTLEARAREMLAGLGFSPGAVEAPLHSLSGGWWMRVELARLLLTRPDFLFLDEPTNHLDLPSLRWLEQFLEGYSGAWVVVSHDRYFLNRMVRDIAELSADSGLLVFPGNYDAYVQARAELAERLAATARAEASRRAEVESFIARFRYSATKARQVQSRVKQLERQGTAPQARPQAKRLRFSLPQPPRSGDIVIDVDGLGKAYGGRTIYDNFSLQVRRGDKLALLGPNGAGKSTLLKMLAATVTPDAGRCRLGHGVTPYYFAQHQLDTLDPSRSVFEEMQAVVPLEPVARVRGLLGAFLFSGDAVDRRVGVLSGGEKSRLALAKMLARPANLLLLDEPTNHLDLASRDMLEAALVAFTGTVVFISHDRYFINSLASQVLEVLPGGRTEHVVGDYDYFLWKQGEQQAAAAAAAAPPAAAPPAAAGGGRDAEGRRRRAGQRQADRQAQQVAQLEAQIAAHEARQKEIDAALCDPEIYADAARCRALMAERAEHQEALEGLLARWEQQA